MKQLLIILFIMLVSCVPSNKEPSVPPVIKTTKAVVTQISTGGKRRATYYLYMPELKYQETYYMGKRTSTRLKYSVGDTLTIKYFYRNNYFVIATNRNELLK